MVRGNKGNNRHRRHGLVAGNYCHDVLFRNGAVVAETLGGAASFVSAVLDALSLTYSLVSKVGPDFAHSAAISPRRRPTVVPSSRTTLFHAHFHAAAAAADDDDDPGGRDRVLRRIAACDPIFPSDLPDSQFDFGMAVGVGGEILPGSLEKMIRSCDAVFVDIQALIRTFDSDGDGGGGAAAVRLVSLRESGFFGLLPRIGFLKASGEEAAAMDVEEVRKLCCVVVTNGKRGCSVYWKDGEDHVGPFPTTQVDPTGAGDCFLGGFAAGLVQGLPVPDAALIGNLFGSLAVGQIGVPKFDSRLLQRVKDEIQRRKIQCNNSYSRYDRKDDNLKFVKLAGFEQFYASLAAAKVTPSCAVQECQRDMAISSSVAVNQFNTQPKLLNSCVFEETIQRVE